MEQDVARLMCVKWQVDGRVWLLYQHLGLYALLKCECARFYEGTRARQHAKEEGRYSWMQNAEHTCKCTDTCVDERYAAKVGWQSSI